MVLCVALWCCCAVVELRCCAAVRLYAAVLLCCSGGLCCGACVGRLCVCSCAALVCYACARRLCVALAFARTYAYFGNFAGEAAKYFCLVLQRRRFEAALVSVPFVIIHGLPLSLGKSEPA